MMILSGSKKVTISRLTTMKASLGDCNYTEYKVLKPESKTESVNKKRFGLAHFDINNCIKGTYTNLMLQTEAETPFFWTGPSFALVYDYRTLAPIAGLMSWISAESVENADDNIGNCLDSDHLHQYILFTRAGSYKLGADASRMYTLLISLNAVNKNETAKLAVNLLTKSLISRAKLTSHVHFELDICCCVCPEIVQEKPLLYQEE